MVIFEGYFYFFQEPYFVKSWGVFAFRSVNQDASFELSKTVFLKKIQFFDHKGIWGGQKVTRHGKKRLKKISGKKIKSGGKKEQENG